MAGSIDVSTGFEGLDGASSTTTTAISTAGSKVFVAFVYHQATSYGTASNMSDSQTNTWVEATGARATGTDTPYTQRVQVFYSTTGNGNASHTFTYAQTNAYASMIVVEVSGLDTGDLVQEAGGQEDDSSPFTDGGITTTEANSFMLAGIISGSTTTGDWATAGGGFTKDSSGQGGSDWAAGLAYRTVSSTGTYECSWTGGNSSETVCNIIAFKESSGSIIPQIMHHRRKLLG